MSIKQERAGSTVYYERDADVGLLRERRIAVLGYGSQGRSQALNLRDSGCQVVVAQRPGGANYELAMSDSFTPVSLAEGVRSADLLVFALPDEASGALFESEIAPHLHKGQALGFLHGFAIRFGLVRPPKDVDVILVAPKGPGPLVRDAYVRGGGLTCLIGVDQDATGAARRLALAWGAAVGGGKGGMMETTFAEECEADLFGEQAVLCGGVIELMKAAYEVLVESGVSPEVAYFECVHELKQIVDLQYAAGLEGMRSRISRTASYGGLTRGPRLAGEGMRKVMREMMDEIRSGAFAKEWVAECKEGRKRLSAMEAAERAHASEAAGRRVREAARAAIAAAMGGAVVDKR